MYRIKFGNTGNYSDAVKTLQNAIDDIEAYEIMDTTDYSGDNKPEDFKYIIQRYNYSFEKWEDVNHEN